MQLYQVVILTANFVKSQKWDVWQQTQLCFSILYPEEDSTVETFVYFYVPALYLSVPTYLTLLSECVLVSILNKTLAC